MGDSRESRIRNRQEKCELIPPIYGVGVGKREGQEKVTPEIKLLMNNQNINEQLRRVSNEEWAHLPSIKSTGDDREAGGGRCLDPGAAEQHQL